MALIWDDEIERYELKADPGQWVDLKKELSSGDDDAVWERVVTAEKTVADDLKITFRVQVLNRERVRRSISAWSYTRAGAPVEVSDANVDRMDRRTYAEIVKEVDRRNPFVVGEKTVSASGSSPTSLATARRRKA
jgi:hypothetical protein